ncbi:DUF2849 domain-containing protein [Rhizorhapis sp. SPR117]|uniref:DUF2849 domain-containing protein n=1 Tax=Rhizorhapis sp. SPR117 TaxID=2912611 RepID=UPI001F4311F8|nr:DUF2849 domain-containing protein [Rhizorhapis sp. SPR117]
MIILTGNDLKTGDVTWWTGTDWSRHVDEAVDVGADGELIIARETAARQVNSAYIVEATKDENGVRPAHIKDRIRAVGPTVRPDLGLKPADPTIGNWVI